PLYLGASSNAVTRTGLHALALHDALPISSSVTALNQAFARRSGALQNCFQKNTEGLSGSPQVTIKFRVGTAGNVESASLQPEALAGTALGSCLLSVARSTTFPPQEKSVAFSIPFQASVSR